MARARDHALAAFQREDGSHAAFDVDRGWRQRKHFRDTRAAPSEHQAKQPHADGRQSRLFDEALPLMAVRYFPQPKLLNKLPERRSRIVSSAETEWPILLQQERYSQITVNLHTAMQMPCRFFDSAWQIIRF